MKKYRAVLTEVTRKVEASASAKSALPAAAMAATTPLSRLLSTDSISLFWVLFSIVQKKRVSRLMSVSLAFPERNGKRTIARQQYGCGSRATPLSPPTDQSVARDWPQADHR